MPLRVVSTRTQLSLLLIAGFILILINSRFLLAVHFLILNYLMAAASRTTKSKCRCCAERCADNQAVAFGRWESYIL